MRKRIVTLLAVLAGLLSTMLFTAPAQAAGLPLGAGPENVPFSRFVTDAGGQNFEISGTWGHTYKDNAGNFRVTLFNLKINAVGVNIDDQGLDARVRVYNGYADGHTTKIQDRLFDGADDPILFNPRNPLNRPFVSKITIDGVGVDGDGLDGAGLVTVVQPVIGDGVTP